MTNENGASYEFFYDVASRLIKEIDFDGKETIYKYDETDGNLASSIEVASAHGQELRDRAAPKDRIQNFYSTVWDVWNNVPQAMAMLNKT